MNNVTAPKQIGSSTSRLLVACEGADNYRYFGLLYGNPPPTVTTQSKVVVNKVCGAEIITASATLGGLAEYFNSYD